MAMRSGMVKIQQQMAAGQVSQPPSDSAGFLHWPDVLARAVFFAKMNLVLVVMSVTTTTLFYLSFMVITVTLVQAISEDEFYSRFGLLFISWLLDSLFNDFCVVFVGFGPTANALATVGEATKAETIGAAIDLEVEG